MGTGTKRTLFSVFFALLVIGTVIALFIVLHAQHNKTYAGAQIVCAGQGA